MQLSANTTDESSEAVKASLSGRVTQKEVSALTDIFRDNLGEEIYGKKVAVDMAGAEFIDSSGISWLLSSHKRFQEGGGVLMLHSMNPTVMNVLKVLRMHLVLSIADNEKNALEKLQGQDG